MEPYGKFYAKTFTGSMMGAGSHVIAVMAYAIANAKPPGGCVELNPKLLSVLIGDSEERMREAINYLSTPDPNSRSKNDEGRRVVQIGQFEYRLVNWSTHRDLGSTDEQRAYWAKTQAAYRRSKAKSSSDVNDSQIEVKSPHAYVHASDSTSESEGVQGDGSASESHVSSVTSHVTYRDDQKPKKFSPPTLPEILLQAEKIGLPAIEAEKFFNYYESNGWRAGRNPMKSWRHSLGNWKINSQNYGNKTATPGPKKHWGGIDRNAGTYNASRPPGYYDKAVIRAVPDAGGSGASENAGGS